MAQSESTWSAFVPRAFHSVILGVARSAEPWPLEALKHRHHSEGTAKTEQTKQRLSHSRNAAPLQKTCCF